MMRQQLVDFSCWVVVVVCRGALSSRGGKVYTLFMWNTLKKKFRWGYGVVNVYKKKIYRDNNDINDNNG